MPTYSILTLFHFDVLAKTMSAIVMFIGIIVGLFAKRYIQGDSRYYRFFALLGLLVLSLILMVSSDHIGILFLFWGMSNLLLVRLMVHNTNWQATRNAGWVTAKTLVIGLICLALAFSILYYCTNETSIRVILHSLNTSNPLAILAMLLILVAAMSQSALWPFHRWLTSSLNSPTPVSAIMHAGLVNGGGFLLARFAPLYISQPVILNLIFILGLCTALIGTWWKLIQNDVKRMLACSTIGQMGFMFVQCGLGLFPAAIAHLCWHGLFKANLFLSSSSAATENRLQVDYPLNMLSLFLALICGVLGSYLFAITSNKTWLANDTTFILVSISFVAATQFALPILKNAPLKNLPITILLTVLASSVYGLSVWAIEAALVPIDIMHPQALNAFHLIGLVLLIIAWLIMIFKKQWISNVNMARPWLMLYVKALNDSQPHPSTITAHRNQYQYD